MSAIRIKLSGEKSAVHCIGRIVGAEYLIDDIGKEVLTGMMWKMAAFCAMVTKFGCLVDTQRVTIFPEFILNHLHRLRLNAASLASSFPHS